VPHRTRVILARVVASVTVGAASMLFALVVGVVGNLVGTAIRGTDPVWDGSVTRALHILLGA
jgi:ABC-2 type transport system permease protein